MDLVLAGPNIPYNFEAVGFSDYDTRRGDAEIVEALQTWDPLLDEPIVLMQGRPGLGKTMLACAALNECQGPFSFKGRATPLQRKVLRQERFPVYFIQLAELIELHIRFFRLHDLVTKAGRDPSDYYELERFLEDLERRVRVLVIDDVGKEHRTASGFAEDVFDLLVRHRMNSGLATVMTSNLPLYRWDDQYTPSMKNLIQRSGMICEF